MTETAEVEQRLPGRRRRDRVRWSRFSTTSRPAPPAHPLDRSWVRDSAWVITGFLGLILLLRLVLPVTPSIGVQLYGVVIGCINALVAIGLILVFRSNRIINFAQAEIGIFGAILFENLMRSAGLPWFAALLVGVAASAALAGILEYTLVRRFAKAPRLILTVVTIGLAQVTVVLTYLMANRFGRVAASGGFETPLSDIKITITNVIFRGDALILVITAPLIVISLNVFLKRTDFGVAVRAAAESGDRAGLLGVPVKRVSTVMWIVAGGIGGLATILRAPVVGLISGSTLQGPGLLLRALAAAVIARMDNMRTAVLAAIGIGIVEQSLYLAYGGSPISNVVFVAIIIGALIIQRPTAGRSEDGDTSTWAVVDEVRAIPRALARLPEVRIGRVAIAVLVGGLVLGYPLIATPSKENLASAMTIYAIVAVSLVVLTGWSGQISLGQFGIVGLGAAVAARLSADAGVDFLLAMLIGGVAGSLAALVLGTAALRIKGFFFAVTSLGFAVAVETYFLNVSYFRGLVPVNRPERPILLERFDLESETAFYYFAVTMLALVIVMVRGIRRSRTGRALLAVRDNEKAAQSYGINRAKNKLLAFAVSGYIAGIAGALFAVHQHAVSATAYSANESLRVFSMVVIGGLGSVPGAVLGAVFVRGSSFLLSPQLAILASGLGLLVVLLVFPGGLGRLLFTARDAALRKVAERRGIVVPSLLRDERTDREPIDVDEIVEHAGLTEEPAPEREMVTS
ncbi:MAG TPA: ABC transporter permease [Acidimicrobiales bacterium]|nr:ABC transporter permease [Acidimicrobiales bacterium]